MGKLPFFRAAMAGLGKYSTGGYGRIGVCRVKMNLVKLKGGGGGCLRVSCRTSAWRVQVRLPNLSAR